jgi:hypothetical protein
MRARGALILALFAAGVGPARADMDAFDAFLKRGKRTPELRGQFTFVRIEYASVGGYGESWYNYDGRTWQRWETDYPEAEENFLYRLTELTTLSPNPRPISLKLTDERLFDYPFIYMCDVGWMELSREEKTRLRQYLLRGGFLWVDDFWGQAEWDNLERTMRDRDLFPDLKWRRVESDHPILQAPFKLDGLPGIPARDFFAQGMTHDPEWIHRQPTYTRDPESGVETPHLRGWFDDEGRLMVLATHNTDLGDGWERESEDEDYFYNHSTKAYALGINIIVYALTH